MPKTLDQGAISLLITVYPSLANACETRVVPEKPSRIVFALTFFTSSSTCGMSFSLEPMYLMPSVGGEWSVCCTVLCQWSVASESRISADFTDFADFGVSAYSRT